jgi:hypothetical protein
LPSSGAREEEEHEGSLHRSCWIRQESLDEVAQDVLDVLGNPEGLRYYAS